MRKIGYFKFKNKYFIKDGIYEYIIDPFDNCIGIINPVRKDGDLGWEVDIYDIKYGYKEGERGDWVYPTACKIFPLTPALKVLYGEQNDN